MDAADPRYHRFGDYLRRRFEARVFKVPIDAGFTCPNRDGRLGTGGCIYCDGRGSRLRQSGPLPSVAEQLRVGMERYRRTRGATLFIPYFQTFTNTDAPPARLAALWHEALAFPGTVGLAVGTRPDCAADEVLDLLADCAAEKEIWIEFGLQSIHDRTLRLINRCHSASDFSDAVRRAAVRGLKPCAHVILGLPGESDEEMRETARALGRLPIAAVKIHLLLILDGTPLAEAWRRGEVAVQTMEEYVSRAADFLELLPPEVVIQRLTADGYDDVLLAPDWARHKLAVIAAITRELARRGTRQGSRFKVQGNP